MTPEMPTLMECFEEVVRKWAQRSRFLGELCSRSRMGIEYSGNDIVSALANADVTTSEIFGLLRTIVAAMEKQ